MAKSSDDNALGRFLQDRRRKLDPASLGYPLKRRRTPGLRREEVATRANVSPAWYTWLEQGRGGRPSADVLERLAHGLFLSGAEREYLFMLAQNRPPEVRFSEPESVDPMMQRLLDSLEYSPAAIRTSAWDALASNRAAQVILAPDARDTERYNILEHFFHSAAAAEQGPESPWWHVARAVVAQFRADTVRAGFGPRAQQVVEGLCGASPMFRKLWNALDVGLALDPVKTFVLPGHGAVRLAPATFSVDGHPGLTLVIFTPATDEDLARVRRLVIASRAPRSVAEPRSRGPEARGRRS